MGCGWGWWRGGGRLGGLWSGIFPWRWLEGGGWSVSWVCFVRVVLHLSWGMDGDVGKGRGIGEE